MSLVDKYLPEWAQNTLKGNIPVKAVLPTKDGRRVGNAIVFHIGELWDQKTWWIITDAGTVLRLTHNELAELFHQPLYQAFDFQLHLRCRIKEEMDAINAQKADFTATMQRSKCPRRSRLYRRFVLRSL